MKKLLLSAMLVGLAAGAFAQGQINLSNGSNSGTGPTATTGGLFFLDLDGPGGTAPGLINADFNVNFYGGSDANSLTLLKSLVNSGGGAALGAGTFLDLSGVPVSIPGALTSGFFRIEAWQGAAGSTFPGAGIRGESSVFSNPLGNPNAQPPGIPTDFTGMPAIILQPVPEPSTFALAGLGAAALLIFRRRK
jgi:hypothetical protein